MHPVQTGMGLPWHGLSLAEPAWTHTLETLLSLAHTLNMAVKAERFRRRNVHCWRNKQWKQKGAPEADG